MKTTPWYERLHCVADDDRLVGAAGVLPVWLMAERLGLAAALTVAMARPGVTALRDRGQALIGMAVTLLLGGEAISDIRGLRHLAPVLGQVASVATMWRILRDADDELLGRVNRVIALFRDRWWALLEASPRGFPWLTVAGRTLTGTLVLDSDATVVLAASGKQNAKATYKGGIGFVPIQISCDNTDDVLLIDPRPGNATSNDAADNITALRRAIFERVPERFRSNLLIRLDGAGFSHALLAYIASGGRLDPTTTTGDTSTTTSDTSTTTGDTSTTTGDTSTTTSGSTDTGDNAATGKTRKRKEKRTGGRARGATAGAGARRFAWEFSVGWACTDREMDAIAKVRKEAWTRGIAQDGTPLDDVWVAEITDLVDLSGWDDVPGLRLIVRDEPLHPKYLKRASEREKKLGRRYQVIAVNARTGQHAWLDARHRGHVHVESDIKQNKALGLARWPSKFWAHNVAWTQIVLLAACLLAAYRLLVLPPDAPDLRVATPKLLRYRLWDLPGRLTHGQRNTYLHIRHDWPWRDMILRSWANARALPTLDLLPALAAPPAPA